MVKNYPCASVKHLCCNGCYRVRKAISHTAEVYHSCCQGEGCHSTVNHAPMPSLFIIIQTNPQGTVWNGKDCHIRHSNAPKSGHPNERDSNVGALSHKRTGHANTEGKGLKWNCSHLCTLLLPRLCLPLVIT